MAGALDRLERARRHQARGRDLMAVGKPREAERVLTKALEVLGAAADDRARAVLLARVHITLANAEFELRGLGQARARLAIAADAIEEHGLRELQISLQNQRGLIALRAGLLTEAVAEFNAATPFAADAPANERCYVLLNRSVAKMDLSALPAARSDLVQCVAEARAAGLTLLERMATHNLGYVESLAGNLPEALRLMDAAVELDATASPAIMQQGKAEVLVEAGLIREADDTLAVAAQLFRTDRLTQDLAIVELDRARCALALGDPGAARRFAAAARTRFRRQGSDGWRRAAETVLLQAELAGGRSGARLVAEAQRLCADLHEAGVRLPARIAALIAVEAHLAAGDIAGGIRELARVRQGRKDDPITGRMHSHYVHARVDAARGEPGLAARRIRRALDELARYQASFGSIDLRTASALHGRRLAELDISLALESGRAASVYAAVERARAVSSRLPAVHPPDDPAAAALLAELRQVLESLRAVEQDVAASEPLLRKRRELERQIVARSWTVSGSGAVTRPASLDAVRARLADRERVMVTYVQAGSGISAIVIGRQVRIRDLGASAPVIELVRRAHADLDVLAHPTLPDGIRAAVRASLHRSLRELDDMLVAPLRLDGSLVLVSTGVLGQLPWASLPSLRGRSLVVAPSATKWLGSTGGQPSGSVVVAALAGPDLGRGDAEGASVGVAWPTAQVVSGAQATTVALTEAMRSATVLHIAAHGVHQPENPLFSSVRMVDGPVFAHELDQKAHAPEHVVLSACEVGLATVRPGDEALGLASVLLHLGTRSVIAGVARVGDEIAEQTMATYHSKLAAGSDSSVALAEALAEVDADVTPPFVNFGAAWAVNHPGDLERGSPVT